jgi:hypothetical protein
MTECKRSEKLDDHSTLALRVIDSALLLLLLLLLLLRHTAYSLLALAP